MTERIVEKTASGKDVVHGRASSYNNHGCRCDPCTKAWREYMQPRIKRYRQKKRQAKLPVQIDI